MNFASSDMAQVINNLTGMVFGTVAFNKGEQMKTLNNLKQ